MADEQKSLQQIIDFRIRKLSKLVEEGVNPWGVFDHYLFDRSIDIMTKNAKEQPTFITILSTTNHLPWIIPNIALPGLSLKASLDFSAQRIDKFIDSSALS